MNYRLPNQEKALFVTHESGFNNVKIYFEGKMLARFEDPSELFNQQIVNSDSLGALTVELKNRKLEIRQDNLLCIPEVSQVSSQALKTLHWIFWVLAFFALFTTSVVAYQASDFLLEPEILVDLFINVLAIAVYISAAILTFKGKSYGYLIGTFFFTLTTILYVYIMFQYYEFLGQFSVIQMVVLTIRLAILGLLFYKMKQVINTFRKPRNSPDNSEILDEF